jgi:hypothetical protein
LGDSPVAFVQADPRCGFSAIESATGMPTQTQVTRRVSPTARKKRSTKPSTAARKSAPAVLKQSATLHGNGANGALSLLLESCSESAVKAVIEAAGRHDYRSIDVVKFGLAAKLVTASTSKLSDRFMEGLVGGKPPTLCARVLEAYISRFSSKQRRDFFDPAKVVSKKHPARRVFSGAAFNGEIGETFLDALRVLMAHGFSGASFAAVVERCDKDISNACLFGNQGFRAAVSSELPDLPKGALCQVLESPRCKIETIDFLVDHWGVSWDSLPNMAMSLEGHKMVNAYNNHLDRIRPAAERSYGRR